MYFGAGPVLSHKWARGGEIQGRRFQLLTVLGAGRGREEQYLRSLIVLLSCLVLAQLSPTSWALMEFSLCFVLPSCHRDLSLIPGTDATLHPFLLSWPSPKFLGNTDSQPLHLASRCFWFIKWWKEHPRLTGRWLLLSGTGVSGFSAAEPNRSGGRNLACRSRK